MSKATVTWLFIAAALTAVAGVVIAVAAVVVALAGGAVTIGGPAVVAIDGEAFGGTLAWLALASLAIGVGALAALASWVGALINTVQLEDKTWFVGLLVLGLLSFGWVAMIAYVVFGPDGRGPHHAADVGVRLSPQT